MECFDRFCRDTRMNVHVKTFAGQSVCCDVSPYDTLDDFRSRLEGEGQDCMFMVLHDDGRTCVLYDGGRTLKEHELTDGSSVHVVGCRTPSCFVLSRSD